jgi:hypothetical protein
VFQFSDCWKKLHTHHSINQSQLLTHWFTNILTELNSCHKINSRCWRESKCFEVSKQIPDSSFDLKGWKDVMITWTPGNSDHVVHKFHCIRVLHELNFQLYGAESFSVSQNSSNWSWISHFYRPQKFTTVFIKYSDWNLFWDSSEPSLFLNCLFLKNSL